jgi:hypothetical protein
MSQFSYRFTFSENENRHVRGQLELDKPQAFHSKTGGDGYFRPGRILLKSGSKLDIVLYHSQAISKFMYMRNTPPDKRMMEFIGLSPEDLQGIESLSLPGQLCLGSDRSKLIGQAIRDVTAAPPLSETVNAYSQQNLAVFPIAREGLKYQVAESLYENYGYYCDEVVLDAHHVFDSNVPVYNRKVEMTLFKDKDLDKQQHENIAVAFIADSIASGLVLKEVIERVEERFEQIKQIEIIAPLATVRGLCRIASTAGTQNIRVRVHVFETLLNALYPDFYYSAHFDVPEMHIMPELEQAYREWWGQDAEGRWIADTACAGYGWSEVFFSPRKQIQMINSELESRHNLSVAEIVKRNLR